MIGRSFGRIPTIVIVLIWVYCGWRVIKSGWIGDAWSKARDYQRKVHL